MITLDIECYRDYFEAVFVNHDNSKVAAFELYEGHPLDIQSILKLLNRRTLVTFNGTGYDLPILSLALNGASNQQLKDASDDIIKNRLMYWEFGDKYNIHVKQPDHIDIQQVLPGKASLKLYGARLGCARLQDLPINPDASIRPQDRKLLTHYCVNDNLVTGELCQAIWPEIELREHLSQQYNLDLRSKSDAQIAEAIIKSEYQRITRKPLRKPAVRRIYEYEPPFFLQFRSPELQELLAEVSQAEFRVNDGEIVEPACLHKRHVTVGQTRYKLGIGGIHAVNKCEAYHDLMTIDVASYYPNLIINCGFTPPHMGDTFLKIYQDIVTRRLEAKRTGDKVTSAALKLSVNGIFGKLGSKYSVLYAPNMMIQVTVTGQLTLLMLIEELEHIGARVVSANTDGMEVLVPPDLENSVRDVVTEWEQNTGLVMEYGRYRSIHYRDVNNYIAITPDGEVKAKGAFALGGLDKNPFANISIKAAIALIRDGTPVEDTVRGCQDVRDLLMVRTVKGGGHWTGELLGKAVRWYYSTDGETIHYVSNNNKVPQTEDARPMMELTGIPPDVYWWRYIDKALEILETIGYEDTRTGQTNSTGAATDQRDVASQ